MFEAAFQGRRQHAVQLAAQRQEAFAVRVRRSRWRAELAFERSGPPEAANIADIPRSIWVS